MKVIKNFLYNAFYQIFILLVPLVTTPYLARVLGPQGVGINSYTNSIIQYFILFGCLGTNLYGNRKIAFVRNDKYKLSQTFYEILLVRVLMLIIAYGAFFIFLFFTNQYHTYYLAQSVMIIATIFDISWFFMGIEKFDITVVRNFVVRILTLICIFVFVKSYHDLMLYILILSLSSLIGNLTLFPNLRKYIMFPNLNDINIIKHLYPSLMLFIPEVATQVYLVLNKTMLGSLVSVKASGYYDQSDKIIKMVLAVVTATGTVMLPHVANAFANGKKKLTKVYLYDTFSIVTALSVPMMFGIMAVASKLVPLFFTNKFMIVSPLMMVESVVILLIAWSNAIGTQYLLPTKQTNAYTTSVVIGAVVNIIINIPLIMFLGTMGSIISTVISEISVTGYQLYAIRGQINYLKLFNNFYKYFLSGLIMFILIWLLNNSLPFTWTMLVIEILIGIIVYGLLILLMKTSVFEILKKMKNDY